MKTWGEVHFQHYQVVILERVYLTVVFPTLKRILMGVIFVQGYKLLVEEQAGEEDRINPRRPFPVLAFLGCYRVGCTHLNAV